VKALSGIVATLVLLVAPSTGVAQTKLPVGEAHGVRIVREHGAIVVVFTQRAERLYKRIAGRVVEVDCVDQEPRQRPPRADTGGDDPIGVEAGGGVAMRAPKHRRKLVTGDLTRGMDYCRVWLTTRPVRRHGERQRIRLIVSIPLTQTGAVFLDEESKARELVLVLVGASLVAEKRHLLGWPTYEVLRAWGFRRFGKRFVRLDTPTGTPPAGAIGYWSDGHDHVAVAVLSASGRRLFIEQDADALSTNVTGYIFIWRPQATPYATASPGRPGRATSVGRQGAQPL
jgi:hypothetical protein